MAMLKDWPLAMLKDLPLAMLPDLPLATLKGSAMAKEIHLHSIQPEPTTAQACR